MVPVPVTPLLSVNVTLNGPLPVVSAGEMVKPESVPALMTLMF